MTIAPAARSRLHDDGVSHGPGHRQRQRAGRGALGAGGVDVVLHEHRYAVERAPDLTPGTLCVQGLRGLERIGTQREHGMQSRTDVVDLG